MRSISASVATPSESWRKRASIPASCSGRWRCWHRGCSRSNERRMRAIGFPTYRYKLTCFVISGVMCGLAGVLLANHTDFINPSIMFWTRSGDLIVMAVLGGMGTVFGPVIGAIALLVLEEALPVLIGGASQLLTGHEVQGAREYWQLILGPM